MLVCPCRRDGAGGLFGIFSLSAASTQPNLSCALEPLLPRKVTSSNELHLGKRKTTKQPKRLRKGGKHPAEAAWEGLGSAAILQQLWLAHIPAKVTGSANTSEGKRSLQMKSHAVTHARGMQSAQSPAEGSGQEPPSAPCCRGWARCPSSSWLPGHCPGSALPRELPRPGPGRRAASMEGLFLPSIHPPLSTATPARLCPQPSHPPGHGRHVVSSYH